MIQILAFVVILIYTGIIIYLFAENQKLKETIKKQPKVKSEELADFLTDMQTHGYSVVRINPDNVFFRKTK